MHIVWIKASNVQPISWTVPSAKSTSLSVLNLMMERRQDVMVYGSMYAQADVDAGANADACQSLKVAVLE